MTRLRARFSYDDLVLSMKFCAMNLMESKIDSAHTAKCLLVHAGENSPPRIRTSVLVHSGSLRLPGQ